MANLLIEIGNTALKAAWSDGKTLGKTFRYQGEKMMDYLLSIMEKDKPEVLAIATVNYIAPFEEEILAKECGHLIILDRNHTDTLLRYDLPEYLSYDRAACLIAAAFLFKGKPCTVFDFGTTLSVDFLNPEGKYEGGNISLGCRTRFKALERYSKSLPLVDTPESVSPEGYSLVSSIESGIISGIMFEIDGYIARHPGNIVVFTGGDAVYFANKMSHSIFVVSNLVMMGMAIITEDYVAKNIG